MNPIGKIEGIALILFCFISSSAQEVKWTAQWIMHPTVEPHSHAVILFRKDFQLHAKPKRIGTMMKGALFFAVRL